MPREKAGEPLRADIAPAGDRGDEHGGRRRTSPQRQSLQFAHGEGRSRRDSARRYAHELRSSEHAAAPALSGESLIKLADSCLPNLSPTRCVKTPLALRRAQRRGSPLSATVRLGYEGAAEAP